ncbi:hypothetical protein PG991_003560, partial [Apiospora marii]
VNGNISYIIAELLLSASFKFKISTVVSLALNNSVIKAKEFTALKGKLVFHKPSRMRNVVKTLKKTGYNVLYLIPPAHHDKKDIMKELIYIAKKVNILNDIAQMAAYVLTSRGEHSFDDRYRG